MNEPENFNNPLFSQTVNSVAKHSKERFFNTNDPNVYSKFLIKVCNKFRNFGLVLGTCSDIFRDLEANEMSVEQQFGHFADFDISDKKDFDQTKISKITKSLLDKNILLPESILALNGFLKDQTPVYISYPKTKHPLDNLKRICSYEKLDLLQQMKICLDLSGSLVYLREKGLLFGNTTGTSYITIAARNLWIWKAKSIFKIFICDNIGSEEIFMNEFENLKVKNLLPRLSLVIGKVILELLPVRRRPKNKN